MTSKLAFILAVCLVFTLPNSYAGLFSSEDKPSENSLEEQLSLKIKAPWVLDSLEIITMINVGDKVEPVWKFRFRGGVESSESLYVVERVLMSDVAKQTLKKGTERSIVGVGVARLGLSDWEYVFKFEDKEMKVAGRALPKKTIGVIYEGTEEERNLRAQHATLVESIKPLISEYYWKKGPFAGVYKIEEVTRVRIEQPSENALVAHAEYRFLCVKMAKCGNQPSGSDKRIFKLINGPTGNWKVTQIGRHMSAELD